MRLAVLMHLIFILSINSLAQTSWKEILTQSKNYYLNKSNGSISIAFKYKNVLKADTNYSNSFFSFYRGEDSCVAILSGDDNKSYSLYLGNRIYYVNPSSGVYHIESNSKYSNHRMMPFWEPELFFKQYIQFGKWGSKKVITTDDCITLEFSNNIDRVVVLYLDKKTFRILKYSDIVTSKKLGTQYKEYSFFEMGDFLTPHLVSENIQYITGEYRLRTNGEIDDEFELAQRKKEQLINTKMDITKLSALMSDSFRNGKLPEYIIIDFFGQACLPCLKTMSDLNSIQKLFSESVFVLGVDLPESDSGHLAKFKAKYKIDYVLVDGSLAKAIKLLFSDVRVLFPTTIFLKSDGTIVNIMDGYSTKHYKWMYEYLKNQ